MHIMEQNWLRLSMFGVKHVIKSLIWKGCNLQISLFACLTVSNVEVKLSGEWRLIHSVEFKLRTKFSLNKRNSLRENAKNIYEDISVGKIAD